MLAAHLLLGSSARWRCSSAATGVLEGFQNKHSCKQSVTMDVTNNGVHEQNSYAHVCSVMMLHIEHDCMANAKQGKIRAGSEPNGSIGTLFQAIL